MTKNGELKLKLEFESTINHIVQLLLPIWLPINDIHITSKLKTTIMDTINDNIFKTGFTKYFNMSNSLFNIIQLNPLKIHMFLLKNVAQP